MKTPVYMRLNKGNPKVTRTVSQNPKTYVSKRRYKARCKLCLTWLTYYLGKAIATRPRVFDYQVICTVDNNPPEVVQENNLVMDFSLDFGWTQKS